MAARFLVAGGNGNWNDNSNWSGTSGGGSGSSFPVAGDTVTFDTASANANMTVNTASACTSIVVSGTYAGTLTFNANLTVAGTVTFLSTMTIAGTSDLIQTATATMTSGGKTLTGGLQAIIAASNITLTLSGGWVVTGVFATSTTGAGTMVTVNSSTLSVGGITHNTIVLGSTALTITGGTWQGSAAIRLATTLAGNITISGTVSTASGFSVTYSSGTITAAGSTLSVAASATFNTNGMSWNNITITAAITLTINSLLTATGILTIPNAAITFGGSSGFTVGTFTNTSYTTSRIVTLTFGNTYTVTSAFSNVGTSAAVSQSIISSSVGNKVVFTLSPGATQDIGFANPTDINSGLGQRIFTYRGTITTSTNWTANAQALTVSGSF